MAQYTFIDPNTLLPGDPWTSAKAQAAFENPEAIAEGAPGAPRVRGKGLGGIRQAELSATGTTWIEITDLDDYKWIDLKCSLTHNAVGDLNIQVSLSSNNGGTWAASQLLAGVPIDFAGAVRSFDVNVGLMDGLVIVGGVEPTSTALFNRRTFGAGSYNAFRIRQSSSAITNIILRAIPHLWENKS